MSNVVLRPAGQIQEHEFTQEQLELIKATVAKGATDNELKLFLYRCKNMGLDPLKPGMVHFVKYGSNPGTIIVGIEGFRSKAARTGKLAGIKRGVLRDAKGKCVGGWCEVYRSDWQHPAREEVSLAEYNTGKSQWAKMPETMIKKVAEVAALRMAFA
ncbi:MAG: phage recombination protein Bet, partial [Bdellovibrionales bacterium]